MTKEQHEKAGTLLYEIKMYEDHQQHIPDLMEEKRPRLQTMLFNEFIDVVQYRKCVDQRVNDLKDEFEKL